MNPFCLNNLTTVLCLGAHSDDIEIGCGGAILDLLKANPKLAVWWVVFTAEGKRKGEAIMSARTFLKDAGSQRVIVKQFRNGFFPSENARIKEFFETLKKSVRPDVIFTHERNDRHQDHRVISDLTWNTFRSHVILEYEVPKYDGGLGSPNFYIPVSDTARLEKTRCLMKYFGTQRNKHWFSEDLFWGLMRLRGIESDSPTRYAEAFHCRKILWSEKKR